MVINRTKTGIDGLDKALNGGFPEGNIVLISGGAGTGKSTLCLQFLVNGTKVGEKGLYISTEQTQEELIKQGAGFGWDLESLIKKNMVRIIYYDITGQDNFLKRIDLAIQDIKPKRIIVDSMTTLTDAMIIGGINEHDAFSMVQIAESVSPIPRTEQIICKQILYRLLNALRSYKITTLLTSELSGENSRLSADGISEFICDGIIALHSVEGEEGFRTLTIPKMRYTKQKSGIYSFEMRENGIVVRSEE